MKRIVYLFLLISVFGCEDSPPTPEIVHCINHYRAQSYQVALQSCEQSANQGNIEAQWLTANIYFFALGRRDPDIAKAEHYLSMAANHGHRRAALMLGEIYHQGALGRPDLKGARDWFRKWAEKGDADAQYHLAWVLADMTPIDFSQVLHWLRSAAAQRHTDSLNDLAWIYATAPEGRYFLPQKAQRLLEEIDSETRSLTHIMDTEAAVAAANGDFARAIALQQRVLEKLQEDEQQPDFAQRLEAYRQNQRWFDQELPWHDIMSVNQATKPKLNSPQSPGNSHE